MSKKVKIEESELIRTSRAGDVFHYRWAARFCLNMIKPNSPLISITIERSEDSEKKGECVMDMTAYSKINNYKHIDYYQMKHSEALVDKHMTLGFLRNTIEGFAERFLEHEIENSDSKVKYFVVSNRIIDPKLSLLIRKIILNEDKDQKMLEQLEGYTKTTGSQLKKFCSSLVFKCGEGNYEDQLNNLLGETGKLISGFESTEITNKLVMMVWNRVLPNNKKNITREVVLNQFGCSSEKAIYPAPSYFEEINDVVFRKEYLRLAKIIINDDQPKIITATGGIGKSIFTNNLQNLLGEEVLTIKYDCFGNGTYRNPLEMRHRHKEALIQIVNELSDLGYCEPLIPVNIDPDRISQSFQERMLDSINRYKSEYPNGKIVIAIDAADNAEMAGKINKDKAFPSDLLYQGLPKNCILVMLCRPERLAMLDIPRNTLVEKMSKFSIGETKEYLSIQFNEVSDSIAEEVHRLTNGIPRVMSIAIQESSNINEVLTRLGPVPTNVDAQVQQLLKQAINRIEDQLSKDHFREIDVLCCGLAVLPPNIPLEELAIITNINEDTIKSFISEMGAQIILSDNQIHFRDEPTEHWFYETYANNIDFVKEFIIRVMPLTRESIYLASALPELFVLAGMYDEMIEAVVDGKYLPNMIEADIREVEYTRLKYAVRAAIKTDRYKELVALGLMAGDKGEIHNRIYGLYQDNFDIVNNFLSDVSIKELAYKNMLGSSWIGSDNLYTASLLSNVEKFRPESRIFIKKAVEFLNIYFEERKKDDDEFRHESITTEDIFALVLIKYNLEGLTEAFLLIQRWSPDELQFKLASKLSAYLIDLNKTAEVEILLEIATDNAYVFLGAMYELNRIGTVINTNYINQISDKLSLDYPTFKTNYMLNEEDAAPIQAIVTLCEYLLIQDKGALCINYIDQLLEEYGPNDFKTDTHNYIRIIYLRAYAIKKQIEPNYNFNEHLFFKEKGNSHQESNDIKGMFNVLYPWYVLRLRVLCGEVRNLTDELSTCSDNTKLSYEGQYGRFNNVERERFTVVTDIFLRYEWSCESEAYDCFVSFIKSDKYGLPKDKTSLLRGLMRKNQFHSIIQELEISIHTKIVEDYSEPYEKVETLMQLVRGYLGYSLREAKIYFEEAVNENEKFGDDLPNKWRAISSIARKVAKTDESMHELAFRYVRVAEFVGEHVTREKYWDRNEAMKITTLLSPAQGIAALWRWNDRDVGWMHEQLKAVVEALISKGKIDSSLLWSLSGFYPDDSGYVISLAENALKIASSSMQIKISRQLNLISAIKGYSEEDCNRIKHIIEPNLSFDETIYKGVKEYRKDPNTSYGYKRLSKAEIDNLLVDWEYTNLNSVKTIFEYINSVDGLYSSEDYYWKCVLNKVTLPKYTYFLSDVMAIGNEIWSVSRILTNIPALWKKTRSFHKFWKSLLREFGEQYAADLLSWYYRRPLQNQSDWSEDEWFDICTGCIETYKKNSMEFESSEFYDLASLGSMIISNKDGAHLLNSALITVEKDINYNFGDGAVKDKIVNIESMDLVYGSLFKVALASPDCETRWMAVHGLVNISKISDKEYLRNLLDSISKSSWVEYLNSNNTFYKYNYQLYFLIAIQRIVKEFPEKVDSIKHLLTPFIYNDNDHALIKYIIYKIVMDVNVTRSEYFTSEERSIVESWFKSKNKVVSSESKYSRTRSTKYNNLERSKKKFFTAFDFDRYWLKHLEYLFNIPTSHIEILIGNIVKENFDVTINDNGWVEDLRQDLFRSHRNRNKIYSSHGELPSMDTLSFYLSYHGMFIVADKFIKSELLYCEEGESVNPYLEWLENKYLNRRDGYLLIDGRTPTPTNIPEWLNKDLEEKSFVALQKHQLEKNFYLDNFICVKGSWEYRKSNFSEIITVCSVLVETKLVSSLLLTLEDMSPHDYYLGEDYFYGDDQFKVIEWLTREENYSELENHNLWAKGTRYPDNEIKPKYLKMLNLKTNEFHNKWFDIETNKMEAYTENWVVNIGDSREDYYQPNSRVLCTEEYLKKLCKLNKCTLVLNLKVERRIKEDRSDSYDDERHDYHTFKVIDENGWC